jgi:hypothetical protein
MTDMTALLHRIPWEAPATLAAAAILLAVLMRAVRAMRNRDRTPRSWMGTLRAAIVTLGALLAPVFFTDMFRTVTQLLGHSFHGVAWTVPAATEGSFIFLYGLDIYLLAAGKPMGWLRFAPYPFAAVSLVLNVYSSFGDVPGMLGHAVVTVAFFLPLLAGESAVKSLAVTDDAVALSHEMAAARQYAIDLARDQKGWRWRWRVPSLLRSRILAGRMPSDVTDAVRQGASSGGAAKWEAAVEKMVTDALTQRARVTASVHRQERAIQRDAEATEGATADASPQRQETRPAGRSPRRQATASERDKARARAARLVAADPAIAAADLADKCGVSKRTAERWKREMNGAERPLAAVG